MTENQATITVEVTGQQQSASVSGDSQSGTGSISVKAGARDVSLIDMPAATADTIGGIRVGEGLRMDGEVLSADVLPEVTPNDVGKFLRGDNSWATPEDDKIGIATVSAYETYPLLSADHRTLRTGDKVGAVVMYDSSKRPVIHMATGMLYAISFSGDGSALTNLDASQVKTGQIRAERIESLPASKITGGTFDPARLPIATTEQNGAMTKEDKALLYDLLARVQALENG